LAAGPSAKLGLSDDISGLPNTAHAPEGTKKKNKKKVFLKITPLKEQGPFY